MGNRLASFARRPGREPWVPRRHGQPFQEPRSRAAATAEVRDSTPSLAKMPVVCVATVRGLMARTPRRSPGRSGPRRQAQDLLLARGEVEAVAAQRSEGGPGGGAAGKTGPAAGPRPPPPRASAPDRRRAATKAPLPAPRRRRPRADRTGAALGQPAACRAPSRIASRRRRAGAPPAPAGPTRPASVASTAGRKQPPSVVEARGR